MAQKNILIVVKGQKWVEEGNNYAGFSGYRPFKKTFFNSEEFSDFMQTVVEDTRRIGVESIETFTIKPDKVLDVKLQLQLATENKAAMEKREKKAKRVRLAELRKEVAKLEAEVGA